MEKPIKLTHVEDDEVCRPEFSRMLGESQGGALARAGLTVFSTGRSRFVRYGGAVAITAVALLALALLMPLFSWTSPPLVLLALAVAAAAWWGGLGPGLVSTAISIVVAWWAFVPLHYSFAIADPAEAVRLGLAALCGAAISALAEAMHRAAARQCLAIADLARELQERQKMEATLREQAQLLDLSYDAVFAWSLEGAIRYWNSGAERLYGFSRAEALGHSPHELLQTRIDGGLPAFIIPLKRDNHWFGELRHRTHDGRNLVVESRMVLAAGLDADGGPMVIESNRDLTPRRQAEEDRLRLAAIVESSDDAIVSKDLDGVIRSWNAGAERIFGYSAAEAIGRPISLLVPPERMEEEAETLRLLRRGDRMEHLETVRVAKDGRRIDVSLTVSPMKDFAGRIVGASKIARDISDRKRADEALQAAKHSAERAKAVAEQANRAKDHFLAVLSHELRTPLTPVVVGLSMLADRTDLDLAMRETLETVRRNVELEARLIDDLLDVSRIARGKIELKRTAVLLSTIIQRAVEVCRPDIEARGLRFDVELGTAAAVWVEADAGRLQQVFWNLLKNAIKFTPQGGVVGLRCRADATHAVVEVSDNGMGIEPQALPRVFDAFEQVERSITRQFGGLGLGLAICKALVEIHGGQIEADSEGRGKGATFRVRLPLTLPAATPTAGSSPQVPAAAPLSRAVRPLRILLVEDHGVTAKMMRMALSVDGHTVETAGDLATALELAAQHPVDLLLCDLGLPDGSGHDLMRQLRQRGYTFPGIALSGYGQEEDIQRSRQVGFAMHLTKPASREAIVAAVAAVAAADMRTSTA
jgi:two-component system CheB/CheR fusion protein